MKIAILGTGMVGRTIAARLSGLGHKVSIGTRNVEETLNSNTQDIYGNPVFSVWHREHPAIDLASFSEAAEGAGMVFNCTSGQASLAALHLAGADHLSGKVIVDVANPLDFSNGMPPSLNPVNTDSLGEQIQRAFPEAHVVKTLNTMNAFLMVNPTTLEGDHNVFVCGNDEEAKGKVSEILRSFGWKESQVIDLGDITSARGTEMLLPVWLRLWNALGTAEFNFHIQRKA